MTETTEKVPKASGNAMRMLAAVVHMSPWYWVAAVYAVQTLGALIVTFFFKIEAEQTWLPLAILASGALFSAYMGRRDRKKTLSPSLCWLPLLLYALFIFSLSSRSFSGAEVSIKADYFHLVEFATLALFLCCFWDNVLPRGKRAVFFACVLASGLLWGIADEIHQSFVPGRDSSAWDVVYDGVGLAVGCTLYGLGGRLHRWLSQKTSPGGAPGQATPVQGVKRALPSAPINT